ncbi:MAG TPA: DNA-binding protein [Lachnospiraceae bacterium]|nr:DNA-binding protein [Lachnospiraceae bacterium]
MEKLIERGLLFDHYGGLLSEKNKRIYEAAAVDDMSLSEIAEEIGISRQAVSDTLNRTDSKLRRYEDELHLIERNRRIRDRLDKIRTILDAASDTEAGVYGKDSIGMVRGLVDSIEEEL